jgi:hypothetical protein
MMTANIWYLDINGSSVAFTAGDLGHSTEEAIYEVLGRPQCEQLLRINGEPLGSLRV